MMRQAGLIFPVICGLAAMVSVAEAGKDRILVDYDDITFRVDRYNDGRNKPYEVSFKQSRVWSAYTFDSDGIVTDFTVGGEDYKVKYKNNGQLKKVKRTTSTAVLGDDDLTLQARVYSCDDCHDTWQAVAQYGVNSVCDLVGYGNPIVGSAETSIATFCNTFGDAGDTLSAYSVCRDDCEECAAPLTIVLEWFQDGDLDLHVIEPQGGERVYHGNRQGSVGYLEQDNTCCPVDGPERYIGFSGLTPGHDDDSFSYSYSSTSSETNVLGDFLVYVHNYDSYNVVAWKLTAYDGYGAPLLDVEGEFGGDCDASTSEVFTVDLNDYFDNGCDNPNMNTLAVIGNK